MWEEHSPYAGDVFFVRSRDIGGVEGREIYMAKHTSWRIQYATIQEMRWVSILVIACISHIGRDI